eukprot:GHRR01001012.1.p1 GENE.GHRR01001012.1~~GHRR01001012.1.p1  ORF type:complete len:699 (+),score=220.59 GHRR01001012.1:1081-3177(+)
MFVQTKLQARGAVLHSSKPLPATTWQATRQRHSQAARVLQKDVQAAGSAQEFKLPTMLPKQNIVTVDMLRDVRKLLGSLYYEYDYWVQDDWIEGEIPKELHGTYFRNGPGLQVTNKNYSRHPFDGDGMICRFSFRDGKLHFKNKFVHTKGFLAEQAAGRPLYRSAFTKGSGNGSPFFNPFNMEMKNVANTGVLYWAGQLLALWESGLPYALDPYTLETLGETRLNGVIETAALGAHYRITTQPDGSRRWITFALCSGTLCNLVFSEFNETGQLITSHTYSLPGTVATIIHDFAVTEHYYVVVEGPVGLHLGKFMREYIFSKCSIAECLVFDKQGKTRVHLIPRPSTKGHLPVQSNVLEAPPFFSFHHANAYELTDAQLTASADSSSNNTGSQLGSHSNGSSNSSGFNSAGIYSNGLAPSSNGSSRFSPSSPASSNQQGAALDQLRYVVVDTLAWSHIDFGNFNYDVMDDNGLDVDYYRGGARTHLTRLVCDLQSGTVMTHKLARRTLEFPSVNWAHHGQPHTHMYAGGDVVDDDVYWAPLQAYCKLSLDPLAGVSKPLDYTRHVNLQAWFAGERCFALEPIFVPRNTSPAAIMAGANGANSAAADASSIASNGSSKSRTATEDDGWVLATFYDAEKGKGGLLIFDAADVAKGPVARVWLPHHLPSGLHGSWCDTCFAPDGDEISGESSWAPVNKIRPL